MIVRETATWEPSVKRKGRELAMELPLAEVQAVIADALETTVGHGKHSARSAVFHLGRAWTIKELDPEMAAFRCITAEEEAATALFRAVQRHGYPRADELRPHEHTQKNAVRVFVEVVHKALSDSGLMERMRPRIEFNSAEPTAPPQLQLLAPFTVNGKPGLMAPTPPLHFELRDEEQKPYRFQREVQAVLAAESVTRLRRRLQKRANFRNEILYAHPEGVPLLDPSNMADVIIRHRDETFSTLLLLLLVAPYPSHQLFVTQCIDAFLSMLGAVRNDADVSPA